jgi:metal-responsive CopG/Arc/MetJ family transcriptional regulator
VRLNISLPENLVAKIDEYVRAHHATRSGFLAEAARKSMAAL